MIVGLSQAGVHRLGSMQAWQTAAGVLPVGDGFTQLLGALAVPEAAHMRDKGDSAVEKSRWPWPEPSGGPQSVCSRVGRQERIRWTER